MAIVNFEAIRVRSSNQPFKKFMSQASGGPGHQAAENRSLAKAMEILQRVQRPSEPGRSTALLRHKCECGSRRYNFTCLNKPISLFLNLKFTIFVFQFKFLCFSASINLHNNSIGW